MSATISQMSMSKKSSSKTPSGTKMPKHSHKKHRDYSMQPDPKRLLSSSSTSSLSTSSSDEVGVTRSSKTKPSQQKSHGRRSKSKPVYLVQDQKRPSSRGELPQFTSTTSTSSSSSSSTSSSSSSSSSSGRGRTRKTRSQCSSSSSSSSSNVSPVRRGKRSSHSPSAIIKITPVMYETKPKRNKPVKSAPRKSKSPVPVQACQDKSASHCPHPHPHRHHPHQPPFHNEFAYQQQQQMGQSEPIQQIVVENCEPEFETCPHIKKGKVSNQNSCQSSVVLRHVCLKCQKSLDQGRPIVRRSSISGNMERRISQKNGRRNLLLQLIPVYRNAYFTGEAGDS
ncbi:hypothetical protein ACTXT7_014363 [Hymenolepis weldensis]